MDEFKLTPEEQEIEDTADEFRPASAETRERVERILDRARKSQAISLRLRKFDLDMIKKRADEQGMPYQTLISVILHKYVTDQLVDKGEAMKLFESLREDGKIT